jgi:hypothetical protein
MSNMDEALVPIAVFHTLREFLLARSRLESADIECFAYDENMFRMGDLVGGIKLQVRESEARDAVAILQPTVPPDNP